MTKPSFSVKKFGDWLVSNGGVLLATTSPWEVIRVKTNSGLKSLGGHSRAQKVMSLAWKLYRSSPMTGGAFDPLRFALYMRTAHAEVDHENDVPTTMTREEILFIGSDCATKPNGGRP